MLEKSLSIDSMQKMRMFIQFSNEKARLCDIPVGYVISLCDIRVFRLARSVE